MTNKFGSAPHDVAFCATFVDAGFEAKHIEAARNLGLSFSQIIILVAQYGKMVISLCADLYMLYSSGNLSAASILELDKVYGPQVEAMVKAILALAGIPHPV